MIANCGITQSDMLSVPDGGGDKRRSAESEQRRTGKETDESRHPHFGAVRLAPGVTENMSEAGYWLNNDDTVIMTADEIERFNYENRYLFDGEHGITELPDKLDVKTVRDIIPRPEDKEDAENKGFFDGKPVSEGYWKKLALTTNIDALPEKVPVRYGFSVCRSDAKMAPDGRLVGEDAEDLSYDLTACSNFLPFRPLVVLHESMDGEWYFVMFNGHGGWIRKECVALADSREEWLEMQKPKNFLVVTGREIRLADDPYCPELSGQLLPMGTVLPLVPISEAPESISHRKTFQNYIVRLPIRKADGMVGFGYALIPPVEDVHVGFMPFTRDAVIRQAFKYLGDRYGWAGKYHSQDCSGIVKDVFSCFGFDMPRGARAQSEVKVMKVTDLFEMDDSAKNGFLKSLPSGSLVYFPGHIMFWLGDGIVLSAVGSFYLPGIEEKQAAATVMLNDVSRTLRGSGRTWLGSLTAAVQY